MSAETSTFTVAWLHPGYLLAHPDLITSAEHRTRLTRVNEFAALVIKASVEMACTAAGLGNPVFRERSEEQDGGWQRIEVSPDENFPFQQASTVFDAIRLGSLTQSEIEIVCTGKSTPNFTTSGIIAVSAAAGFRDPVGLLRACPIVEPNSAKGNRTAPGARNDPGKHTLEAEIYALQPDLAALFEQANSVVVAAAEVLLQQARLG